MDDNSAMPFGKHKGKKMIDVPADYLLWLHDQGELFGDLKGYIDENIEALRLEVKNDK